MIFHFHSYSFFLFFNFFSFQLSQKIKKNKTPKTALTELELKKWDRGSNLFRVGVPQKFLFHMSRRFGTTYLQTLLKTFLVEQDSLVDFDFFCPRDIFRVHVRDAFLFLLRTLLGSLGWLAPEILNCKYFNYSFFFFNF